MAEFNTLWIILALIPENNPKNPLFSNYCLKT